MESKASSDYVSPPRRLAAFLRGFLPQQTLQLLFPLASLLLLLGGSHSWFELGLPHIQEPFRSQIATNWGLMNRLTHSIVVWVSIEEQITYLLVCFGFLASLVLWVLAVREPLKKFVNWVFVPVGAALIGYPAYFIATGPQRRAFLNAFLQGANFPVPTNPSWLPTPSDGLYLTLAGTIVLVVALVLVRDGRVSLPVRFGHDRDAAETRNAEASRDGRDVLTLLIGAAIWGTISSFLWLVPLLLGIRASWLGGSFPIIEWLPALAIAAVCATIALFLLREQTSNRISYLFRKRPIKEYVLSVVIPVAVVVGPRIVYKVVSESPVFYGSGLTYEWNALLPGPLPRILLVYVIALLAEFALRAYLQTTLERHFSMKKAIFLTALFWWLLALGFGILQDLPLGAIVLARSTYLMSLAGIIALVIYSVVLGWVYARTRSVVLVGLMHGTIALFHVGQGYEIHINHPEFYWVELGLWVLIGWYLFKKHPIESAAVTAVAQPEPV